MFGYIRPRQEELRVCEDELYRAAYCGLCRSMGKTLGGGFRMTLSYDAVFLALVRLAALGESASVGKKRCMVHPLRKRSFVTAPQTMEYCSRAFALLFDAKAKDDIRDSKGIARLAAKLKALPAAHYGKKAGMSELAPKLEAPLCNINAYEAKNTPSPDPLADEFGKLLGELFSHGTDGGICRILRDIGYHTGRWIYILDACDDYADDIKHGRYNPFAAEATLPRERIECALRLETERLSHAIDLLPPCDRGVRDIIENTVYLGMPETAKRILYKEQKQKNNGETT